MARRSKAGSAANTGATGMLREDHRRVKELFDEFERTEERPAKHRLVARALVDLTIHAKLEEELFYPAARRKIPDAELMDEAAEEHHVMELLIGELASMNPADARYDAKFLVLAENARHHIQEEEQEMLPKIERSGLDLESLGQDMSERKTTLAEEVSLESIRGEAWPTPGEAPGAPATRRRSRRTSRQGGRRWARERSKATRSSRR